MKESQRYTHSLIPIPKRKSDKKCRLKDHWSGVCKQVAGYLDYMASLDETGERFVFAGVPKITTHCKNLNDKSKSFKDKPKYSKRAVEAAMHRLRADKVIGPWVRRKRDGIWWEGFIVKSHDKMTSIIDGHCCWKRFKPHSKKQSAGESAGESAEERAVSSAEECAVNASAQSAEPKKDNPQNRALAFEPLRDATTKQTAVTAQPVAVAPKSKCVIASSSSSLSFEDFTKRCVPIWQEYFGVGALLRLPTKSKEDIEFLIETTDLDLLLQAFRLFAVDRHKYAQHDPWAVGRFVQYASKFMLMVKPAKVSTALEDENRRAGELAAKGALNADEVIRATGGSTGDVEDEVKAFLDS